MKFKKFFYLLFVITILTSCEKSPEKKYETENIKIFYKKNNSILKNKTISLNFTHTKDTFIKAKQVKINELVGLINLSKDNKSQKIKDIISNKFDLILIRKNNSMNDHELISEFNTFLLVEKLAKSNSKP